MNRKVLITILAIVGGLAAILFLVPIFQTGTDGDTEAPNALDFGSVVRVSDATFALPPRAGQPAELYFSVTNGGPKSVQLVEVTVAGEKEALMVRTDRPAPQETATVEIAEGETVRFGPDDGLVVFSEYDSDTVPGASVDVMLTFGNAEKVLFSAPVTILRTTEP